MSFIYLDHASTTQPDRRVVEAMLSSLRDEFGNPSSSHTLGRRAKQAVEEAREQVANLIGADPSEISFTSSCAEANNNAIKGIVQAYQHKGRHIILSSIEHLSIIHSAKSLEKAGYEVTYLPVDRYGLIDPEVVSQTMRPDTILVSIMHANHEIGTIEPLAEISRITKEKDVLLHSDANASVGHIPVNVKELGVDLLSFAGHRFYGPKGVGAIYIRDGVKIQPLIQGGIQEEGRRAGTENVPGIVGLGVAAQIAMAEMAENAAKTKWLRDKLEKGLQERVDHIYINGHPTRRLPHFLNLCVEYIEGESLLMYLNQQGIFAASGSPCTSVVAKASHVLRAIGIDEVLARGVTLFSLGRGNTDEEIDRVLEVFPPAVQRLREMSPLWEKKF